MILTYDDAIEAISDGVTDWETLTDFVGRNDLPSILAEVWVDLPIEKLAEAVRMSWVMAEFPEGCLDRWQWLEMFGELGYRHNTERVEPPAEVDLWRGGVDPDRMAWTASRATAEWFRDRWTDGKLWTATVQGSRLLAYYDGVRNDESGRGESEYVIDPTGLEYREVRL